MKYFYSLNLHKVRLLSFVINLKYMDFGEMHGR